MSTYTYTNVSSNRLRKMVEVSRILNSKTNLKDLLSTILDEAVALTGSESASILLLDQNKRVLRFKAAANGMPASLLDTPVPLESSIAGAVFLENGPLIINDVTRDERWHKNVDKKIAFQTESILGVPMHDEEDRPVGVLEAINKLDGQFDGDDVEVMSILADLAGVAVEKARLIDALKEANQRLSELDELKTNFISIASHELRTPLSIILGYVSFLRESADPLMAEQMDSVLNAAIRLRSLIQDMLNLGYVDAGDVVLDYREVNLANALTTLIDARADSINIQQHQVNLRIPAEHAIIKGDRKMLELIMGNLLDNAFKYTPAGGEIFVELSKQAQEHWIVIKNSGEGIPEEQLERVFDRFHQVEHPLTRQFEGMGLGLAIAKELVELHNGRIWAESSLGEGATFYVAFPQ